MCCCPANSSSERGRILAASGSAGLGFPGSAAGVVKRSGTVVSGKHRLFPETTPAHIQRADAKVAGVVAYRVRMKLSLILACLVLGSAPLRAGEVTASREGGPGRSPRPLPRATK